VEVVYVGVRQGFRNYTNSSRPPRGGCRNLPHCRLANRQPQNITIHSSNPSTGVGNLTPANERLGIWVGGGLASIWTSLVGIDFLDYRRNNRSYFANFLNRNTNQSNPITNNTTVNQYGAVNNSCTCDLATSDRDSDSDDSGIV